MELESVDKKKNKLTIEIKDEDHTICNAIKDELNADSAVKAAGYNVEHPLTSDPKMTVETTTSSEPKKALLSATKRLRKTDDKFLKDVKKF